MGAAKKTTIKPAKRGQRAISFQPGGLHQSLGVPAGKPIPAGKKNAALRGDYGPKAQAQARFAKNVLTGPKSGGKPAARGGKTAGRAAGRGR
jgi:hypothetical protein